MPRRPTLIVMLKEPRAGRVKTRLARDIGTTRAAWWYRQQATALLRRLRDPRWTLVLSLTPDRHAGDRRIWPADLARLPQGSGDLGERMLRALRQYPNAPVCLIGSDIPAIQPHHIARAFSRLGRAQMVFGPSTDGGYWLIGANPNAQLRPHLLRGVRWSHPETLSDSLKCLAPRRIVHTDRLRDVDTLADLDRISRNSP